MFDSQENRVLVIVPTFCEAGNIERLVAAIHETLPSASVMIIDDNSPDETGQIALRLQAQSRGRIIILQRPEKAGVGSALKLGFKHAYENGFEWAIQMDADFSHDPAMLPTFLRSMDQADIVIGSRMLPTSIVEGRLPHRSLMSQIASQIGRRLLHTNVRDVSSGYRCWSRFALRNVQPWNIKAENFSFQMESIMCAGKAGMKTLEIPITFIERKVGTSKANFHEVVGSSVDLFKILFPFVYPKRVKPGLKGERFNP